MINVILADDHVLVRDGIKALLEDQTGINVIDEASNGKEALEVVSKNKPHILIVDIRMPEMNGIEVVAEINKHHKDVKTLVLSMHDSEEYVVRSIQAGADGYLLKGASKEEFLKALNKVASGGKYFTGDVSSIIMNNFVNGNISKTAATQKEIKELPFKLTKREKQILILVLELKNNKDIAEELQISKRTAEVHRFNLMKKLEAKNLMELNSKSKEYQLI
ncbi:MULTISPECIES: response regulator transcription factor [unclassified Polaribacter]|jgi:DNA-binding NarL/FixJ family response regulator|uniref:response regulator transcription factor n=1 Tax=unclassified Polaribacter TaxID=196858 RepID=UPI00052C1720|nr:MULTISPECIES: response regulator transcription factor [unclassified Polaribacter]KGL59977.1 transcriptional regulator, LuxR family [Polaribacter sp. Hel1_33_49]MBT3742386.1 response regulator transcription factor [Polaribacter sp.]MBT4413023.1 response regulator transcription factor [Polaribacter sp.]MBT7816344.1 response regulator transcription factor [Polaribacter sp.]MDG1194237.1 response regulator transcription factor [Polaribacter sp.]